MTKTSTAKVPSALAVLPSRAFGNAIVGTIDERIRAFDQIAANLAQLQVNGWDSVQKVKAGCWLADASGTHPATFMNNHHCMTIKAKLIIEPKWEFVLGVLQSRVPNFQFKVLIESDDCAKVWMGDGRNEQTVEYTVADAKRQGLMGRDNAWSSGSTREMCMKQAIKRCGRRLSSAALMDLPVGLDGYEMVDQSPPDAGAAAEQAISEAVLVDDEPAADAERGEGNAAPDPSAAPPAEGHTPPQEPKKNPILALSTALVKMYGKQPKAVALGKASLIYNEMMKEQTGAEHSWIFASTADIGPVQAQQMVDYLATRKTAPKGRATETTRSGGKDAPPASLPLKEPQDDAPPPAEVASADEGRDITSDYDDLMLNVKRAKKLFAPRKFVTEAPPGTGKFWFIDQATFSQAGREASIKLMDDGEIVCDQMVLQALNRFLVTDCDAVERGGR